MSVCWIMTATTCNHARTHTHTTHLICKLSFFTIIIIHNSNTFFSHSFVIKSTEHVEAVRIFAVEEEIDFWFCGNKIFEIICRSAINCWHLWNSISWINFGFHRHFGNVAKGIKGSSDNGKSNQFPEFVISVWFNFNFCFSFFFSELFIRHQERLRLR